MRVSDAEFRRVVRHEAGHTLGFDHEHMRSDIVNRIDRKKAFAFFDRDQGWSREEVEEQVLTPLAKKSIMGTKESDPLSIMCYQLPGGDHEEPASRSTGGSDINPNDFAFAKSLYPKPSRALEPVAPEPRSQRCCPCRDHLTRDVEVCRHLRAGRDGLHARVRSGLRQLWWRASDVESCGCARIKRQANGKTQFGEIIRMHERIKAYTNREKGSLPDDDEMIAVRVTALRHAVSGRRPAPVRRSAHAPAGSTGSGPDLDDSLDRRKAVGVCVRPWPEELPGNRGNPLHPERDDQRSGRSRSSGRMGRCASWWCPHSLSVSDDCPSIRKLP